LTLAQEVFNKIVKTINTFLNNREDGLICTFTSKSNWNFYDWSQYASGTLHQEQPKEADCLINTIAVVALKSFEDICEKIGKDNPFKGIKEEIIQKVNERFFNEEKGLYFVKSPDEEPTELVNAMCVYAGIAGGERAEKICEKLSSDTLVECSLSMKIFKHDALLKTDKKYKENVLSEIRRTYKVMLDADSTTVWETKEGESAFSSAGSLCHGWSAVPIYYYHLLKG